MLIKLVRNAFRAPIGRTISSTSALSRQELDPMQLTFMESESCILTDCDDQVLGKASKKDCHTVQKDGSLFLHRAFSVYLFNSKNELLLQKRAPQKGSGYKCPSDNAFSRDLSSFYSLERKTKAKEKTITYPNCFTNTCCSHPLWDIPGEREEENGLGVRRAAQRRLEVELGIPSNHIHPDDFKYIARFHYKDKGDGVWGEHELAYILFLKGDYRITLNEDEIQEVRYVSLNDFDKFLSTLKDPLTPWFHMLSKHHVKYWWANLHRLDHIADQKSIYRFQDSLN